MSSEGSAEITSSLEKAAVKADEILHIPSPDDSAVIVPQEQRSPPPPEAVLVPAAGPMAGMGNVDHDSVMRHELGHDFERADSLGDVSDVSCCCFVLGVAVPCSLMALFP